MRKNKGYLNVKPAYFWGLDLRSLALFRIGLSLLILLRVIPRSLNSVSQSAPESSNVVLNTWSGFIEPLSQYPLIQGLLILLGGLTAVLLLVGYQTRIMTFLCWLIISTLYPPSTIPAFDAYESVSALLLWSIFLPLGASYSIERALHDSDRPLPKRILSGGTIAFTLQFCLLYLSSMPLELTSINFSMSFLASTLRLIPLILLLIPIYHHFFRSCAMFVVMLTSILYSGSSEAHQNIFIIAICLFAFISSQAWDAIANRLKVPKRTGLEVYYDVDCGFCKKVVHLLRTFLILPGTPLLEAQSNPQIFAVMQEQNSWVLKDCQNNLHIKFEAIAYIVSLSPIFWPVAPLLRWKPIMAIGTKFYETIAANRRIAGKFTAHLKFQPIQVRASKLANLMPLALMTYGTIVEFGQVFAPAL